LHPEQGIRQKSQPDFAEAWGKEGQVLLLQPSLNRFQEKFQFYGNFFAINL